MPASIMQRLLDAAGWDAGSTRHKQLEDAMADAGLALMDRAVEHAQGASANEVLRHYAEQYCEGWCKGAAPNASFDDCGGCKARLALLTPLGCDPVTAEALARRLVISIDRAERFLTQFDVRVK